MTNKSAYALFAALPLIDMFFRLRPQGMWGVVFHAAICGAAIYYPVKNLKPFGVLNWLMVIVAVVYNPFRPFELGTPGWIAADIAVMALFYLISKNTPVEKDGVVKRYADEDPYEQSPKKKK